MTSRGEDMVDTLVDGGILMIPLGICSIVALAVIGEKLYSLRRSKVIPSELEELTHNIKSEEDIKSSVQVFRLNKTVFSKIILSVLENYTFDRQDLKEFVSDVGRHQTRKLQRNLGILETIAGISPLLGLLGTVTGMIRVFSTISEKGIGEAGSLSGGISEALVTTATGLAIAIPSLIAYNYFVSKSEDIIVEIEKLCIGLIHRVKGREN
jgi:biopolymer transport protein ExbB